MAKRPIPILLKERASAAARVREATTRLEQIDAELIARLEEIVGALGLEEPRSPPSPEQRTDILGPNIAAALGESMGSGRRITVTRHSDGRMTFTKSSKYDKEISEILTEANRPMKTGEIYERLVQRGVQVDGKVPKNNLSAHLSHSDRFINTENGWALQQGELRAQ